MPILKRPDAEIHYEVHGKGFPLLLYAPGAEAYLEQAVAAGTHLPPITSR